MVPGPATVDPVNSKRLNATVFRGLLLAGDVVAIFGAVFIMRYWPGAPFFALRFGAVLAIQLIALYLVEAYDERLYRGYLGLPTRIVAAVALAAALSALLTFAWPSVRVTRSTAVAYLLYATPLLLAWRWGGAPTLRRRLGPRRVAVVGDGEAARDLVDALSHAPVYTAAQVIPDPSQLDGGLVEFLSREGIDLLAVAAPEDQRRALSAELVRCRYRGIEVQDMATCFEMLGQRLPVRHLEEEWVAFSSRLVGVSHFLEEKTKRAADVLLAGVGLILASPLLALAAVAVRLTSRGPVIYRQTRVGQHGHPFTLYKLRTMRVDAEEPGRAEWARQNDDRVTPVGAFLRRTHLDELPQLWNVLKGDMSMVGPRPERQEFVRELRTRIPYYDLRHMVKPGLTGWAQIRYPYGASVEDALAKLEYDLYYIRHRDLLWDLRIILRTVTVSLLRRGSR